MREYWRVKLEWDLATEIAVSKISYGNSVSIFGKLETENIPFLFSKKLDTELLRF